MAQQRSEGKAWIMRYSNADTFFPLLLLACIRFQGRVDSSERRTIGAVSSSHRAISSLDG